MAEYPHWMTSDSVHGYAGCDAEPAISIVLLYEDAETGLRAKQALARVQEGGALLSALNTRFWRCDLLRAVWLREQAALEAAAADIIVVSLHGGNDAPEELREFFDIWLKRKRERPCALGVLLDGQLGSHSWSSPVGRYLEKIAESAGAQLLWGFYAAAPEAP